MFLKSTKYAALAACFSVAGISPAFAHLDPLEHGSFAAGFSHPVFGLDHILAMVAIGLWAATLGGKAVWQVPLAFVSVMMTGFVMALSGIEVPFVEPMILASATVLGLFVAVARKLPTFGAIAIAGFFALFHGHAHGGEMGAAGMVAYGLGFALTTVLLHAAGVGLGFLMGARNGFAARAAGIGTAMAGLWLAFGA